MSENNLIENCKRMLKSIIDKLDDYTLEDNTMINLTIGDSTSETFSNYPRIKNKHFLYMIFTNAKRETVKKKFLENKERRNFKYYPHLNDTENSEAPLCLYVGSSNDIPKRFKEHLSESEPNSSKTYALYLRDWYDKKKITIRIITLKEKNDDVVSNEIINVLENQLWNDNLPLLGKKGPSPKSKNISNRAGRS